VQLLLSPSGPPEALVSNYFTSLAQLWTLGMTGLICMMRLRWRETATIRVPAKLKLLDYAALAGDLLIAYIDNAHAAAETEALKILDGRAKPD
jgi:hypothetical protein